MFLYVTENLYYVFSTTYVDSLLYDFSDKCILFSLFKRFEMN